MLFRINKGDNVAVALRDIQPGEILSLDSYQFQTLGAIRRGHKVALTDLASGEQVIKYGFPIGFATRFIRQGEWVHTHNLTTALGDLLEYKYQPQAGMALEAVRGRLMGNSFFSGYRRRDGRVGIRNEIWIVPTVSCVNRTAELIAQQARAALGNLHGIDGIYELKHPYGCSQIGEDQLNTQKALAGLVNHPNAAGVLVLGLGCENNNIGEFQKVLVDYDPDRVKFLVAQEVDDEIKTGVELIGELVDYAQTFQRESCPLSELVVGLKCGGSDAFSGITANPLLGFVSDYLTAAGGATILTEVPEMFGAETILMNRAVDRSVFDKIVALIQDFKSYYLGHGQPIYENPSPGNKEGGITTLEEKSLGNIQKGGRGPVVDVLKYGEQVKVRGLNLLQGPGNDAVSSTALAAAGAQLILFTTGRGTPLGTVIPTIKVASNSELFRKKPAWMDFNAGRLLEGHPLEALGQELVDLVLAVASGRFTRSEKMGFREIAIFKTGVTL